MLLAAKVVVVVDDSDWPDCQCILVVVVVVVAAPGGQHCVEIPSDMTVARCPASGSCPILLVRSLP